MFMTPEAAAAFLGVTPDTIREWARAGKIPAHKFGRLWRFKEEELADAGNFKRSTPNVLEPRIGGAASRSAVERFANRQAQKTQGAVLRFKPKG
jgi:excisionase family DNA binding protein